jgi:hypothetical protein
VQFREAQTGSAENALGIAAVLADHALDARGRRGGNARFNAHVYRLSGKHVYVKANSISTESIRIKTNHNSSIF